MRNQVKPSVKSSARKHSEDTKNMPQKQEAKVLTGLQRLAELHRMDAQTRYPDMPSYALPKPKYKDNTANGLTKCILAFIRFEGGYAVRINTTGQYRKQPGMEGKWTHGTTKRGTADVHSVILNGLHASIEVKIGKDRQSEAQKLTEANVKHAGGVYLLVNSFQDFFERYNALKAERIGTSTQTENNAQEVVPQC